MFVTPYKRNENSGWYKANFHTHAGTGENTCGAYDIDDVVVAYKDADYNILTISNHDLFTDTSDYQKRHDITMIKGFEYSQGRHMLCINVKNLITSSHQEAINECVSQGGFVILCHLNWQSKEYWSYDVIDKLQGYTGIEIYNGNVFYLSGTGLATDKWDYLLSQGKLVWGFGNDDFHRWKHLNRAFNTICAPSNEQTDIVQSIQNGNFYVSTGLILNRFDFIDNVITISASAKDTYVKDYKYVFIGKNGKVLHEHYGEIGTYHLSSDDMYVRVQVVSEHGAMLWTQPIYDDELFVRP